MGTSVADPSRRYMEFVRLLTFVVGCEHRDELLTGLSARIMNLELGDACHVLAYDAEKRALHIMGAGHSKLAVSPALESPTVSIPVDRSVTGRAILTGKPVTQHHLDAPDSGFRWTEFLTEAGCRSVVVVPIPTPGAESGWIGCINIYSLQPERTLEPDILALLSSLAASVGQQIANLWERSKLRAHRQAAQFCARGVRTLGTMDAIARVAKDTTHTCAADVFLRSDDRLVLAGTTGLTTRDRTPITDYSQATYLLGEGITGYAALAQTPIRVISWDDLAVVQTLHPGLNHSGKYLHTGMPRNEADRLNCIAVPICLDGQLCGVIRVVGKADDRPVSQHDVEVLQDISEQLALFLRADIDAHRREERALAAKVEADREHDEFMWTVSHQLRAPLAAIRAHCQDMLGQDQMTLERWNKVRKTLDIWSELAANIAYNFSSVRIILDEPSVYPLTQRNVALMRLLIRAAALHQPAGWKRNIKIHVVEGDDVINRLQVHADEALLTQVFINLLDNAVKYSKPGSHILLSLTLSGADACSVCVQSTGIPIAAEDRERIFDKGYRTQAARSYNPVGTGLGLPIARAAVKLHGGDIRVAVEDGEPPFATIKFCVTLPLAVESVRQPKGRV